MSARRRDGAGHSVAIAQGVASCTPDLGAETGNWMGNFALGVRVYPNGERRGLLSHSMRMFIGMDVRPFVDEEIEPVGVLRVETENSIWFVTSERYQRLPRKERPRPAVRSIEHRLADAE